MAMSISERLYTPSEWSKRYESKELIFQFLEFCKKVTKQTREDIQHQLDVEYGPTERTKYDIYGTNLPNDAPILVFIHGGYWQEFSKDLCGFAVPLFIKNKIKVITIGYDLCPNVKLTDIVTQIKSAVEKILSYAADIGSKGICIAGHSAGAHLAATLLHDDDWINRMTQKGHFMLLKQIVLISGIYNLEPLNDISFGKALRLTENEIQTLSLSKFNKVRDRRIDSLEVFVVVGDCDSPLFIKESDEYAKIIARIVNKVQYQVLPNIDHFDIVEKLLDPDHKVFEIILQCLRPIS